MNIAYYHQHALELIKNEIKRHSFGNLVFLSFVGTRPWGFARGNVDFDYRGIYSSKEDHTFMVYVNNRAVDIILYSLERIINQVFRGEINTIMLINSPEIYITKDFRQFKKTVNTNFSKQIYHSLYQRYWGKYSYTEYFTHRKDYLYSFLFLGNGIAILKKKKIIANLSELNKKFLKIPLIKKMIENEKNGLPMSKKEEVMGRKILNQLKNCLEKAYQRSSLPEKVNQEKFAKLKICKKINYKFWEPGEKRHEKVKETN